MKMDRISRRSHINRALKERYLILFYFGSTSLGATQIWHRAVIAARSQRKKKEIERAREDTVTQIVRGEGYHAITRTVTLWGLRWYAQGRCVLSVIPLSNVFQAWTESTKKYFSYTVLLRPENHRRDPQILFSSCFLSRRQFSYPWAFRSARLPTLFFLQRFEKWDLPCPAFFSLSLHVPVIDPTTTTTSWEHVRDTG